MRILILLSTILVSTFSPNKIVEKEAKTSNNTPSIALATKAATGESAQMLDVDSEYLMKGSWKILSITADKPCDVNGDGYETTDIMSETPTCALDDVMKIYPNHTVSFERRQRCVSSEKAVETYKWKLATNGTFTIIDGTIEAKMILKSANASRMVMLIPMEEDGQLYHFKVTYGQKKQQVPGKILKN
ncbi:MAG: hypothetical protein SFV55_22020 [Haliscomenobacter sp.]|uniref:hypothetical protein n=1 Tax=Haliscomenobacter sp. TaxID=2717303 RepID=UPI0029A3D1A6|nr:hypothetical protein [Haliscomenobacter sp.]MDX2071122.1 hypothetical protein [Haliscomenobacter sp.]